MAATHSDEFKRDAVRIALTSGLTRRQVASDLGIGLSTPGKWVRAVSEEAKVPAQDAELLRENERLRKENRILRDLSRIRKQSGGLFSRRMWEVPKKRRCSSRHKSREVSVYCRVSWRADPPPSVPPDGGVRTRPACLEAPAPVASPAARHVEGMNAIGPNECPRSWPISAISTG
jgi:transposase